MAAPMVVPGAIAATWAEKVMIAPAEAARAPDGVTYTTTGTRALRNAWLISRIEESSPPGVSSSTRKAAVPVALGGADAAGELVGHHRGDRAGNPGDQHRRRLSSRGRRPGQQPTQPNHGRRKQQSYGPGVARPERTGLAGAGCEHGDLSGLVVGGVGVAAFPGLDAASRPARDGAATAGPAAPLARRSSQVGARRVRVPTVVTLPARRYGNQASR